MNKKTFFRIGLLQFNGFSMGKCPFDEIKYRHMLEEVEFMVESKYDRKIERGKMGRSIILLNKLKRLRLVLTITDNSSRICNTYGWGFSSIFRLSGFDL